MLSESIFLTKVVSMKKNLLIIFVLVAIVTLGVQAQEIKDSTTEIWRCFERTDFSNATVLVELTRVTIDNEKFGVGEVSVAGITYPAIFEVAGLNRRWNFGLDELWDYSFIIEPNGDGAYYDFSNVEDGDTTKPSQFFACLSP